MEESSVSKIAKGGISKVAGATIGTLVGKFIVASDPSLVGGAAVILGKAFAEGCTSSLASMVYDDVRSRAESVSKHQLEKVEYVFQVAQAKFIELLENSMDADSLVSVEFLMNEAGNDQAFGAAEHVFIASMNQYNTKKLDVLGKLYGKAFFEDKRDFDALHLSIDIAEKWSYRQILLLYLICKKFCGLPDDAFITDYRVCVELRRLQSDGVWQLDGVPMGVNNSSPVRINQIQPTDFAHELYSDMVLDEINVEDVKSLINCLRLSKDAEGIEVLCPEDVKSPTWRDASGPVLDAGEY